MKMFENIKKGDDVRSIDWGVTAREGKPFVKLYQKNEKMNTFCSWYICQYAIWHDGTNENRNRTRSCSDSFFSAFRSSDRLGAFSTTTNSPCFFPSKRKGKHASHSATRNFYNRNKRRRAPNEINCLQTFSKLSKRSEVFVFLSDQFQRSRNNCNPSSPAIRFCFIRCTDPLRAILNKHCFFPFSGTALGKMLPSGGKNFGSAMQMYTKKKSNAYNCFSDEENWYHHHFNRENIPENCFLSSKCDRKKLAFNGAWTIFTPTVSPPIFHSSPCPWRSWNYLFFLLLSEYGGGGNAVIKQNSCSNSSKPMTTFREGNTCCTRKELRREAENLFCSWRIFLPSQNSPKLFRSAFSF